MSERVGLLAQATARAEIEVTSRDTMVDRSWVSRLEYASNCACSTSTEHKLRFIPCVKSRCVSVGLLFDVFNVGVGAVAVASFVHYMNAIASATNYDPYDGPAPPPATYPSAAVVDYLMGAAVVIENLIHLYAVVFVLVAACGRRRYGELCIFINDYRLTSNEFLKIRRVDEIRFAMVAEDQSRIQAVLGSFSEQGSAVDLMVYPPSWKTSNVTRPIAVLIIATLIHGGFAFCFFAGYGVVMIAYGVLLLLVHGCSSCCAMSKLFSFKTLS